jgi:hypothetical protein
MRLFSWGLSECGLNCTDKFRHMMSNDARALVSNDLQRMVHSRL